MMKHVAVNAVRVLLVFSTCLSVAAACSSDDAGGSGAADPDAGAKRDGRASSSEDAGKGPDSPSTDSSVGPNPPSEAGPAPEAGFGFPGETVQACENAQTLDPAVLGFSDCPLCEGAYCVPSDAVSGVGAGETDLLADCDDGQSKCVPASYVATLGEFMMKTCTAFGQAEGRCVNKCVPQVRDQPGLEQDVCGDNELCAPCFMPTDGSETGACGLGCDPGPTEPPFLFDPCCAGDGVCVPESIVPRDQRSALSAGECTETGALCVPNEFIAPSYVPPTCTSVAGAEGRCIPECVGDVSSQAEYLPQDVCTDGELCAPCYDPTTGSTTGACSLNGDAPSEPPLIFDDCCSGTGSCVPADLVPQNQQGALTPADCELGADAGDAGVGSVLCAPKLVISGGVGVEPDCDTSGDVNGGTDPGSCFDPCTIPGFAQAVPQGSCPDGLVCVPCFVDREPTGACDPSTPLPPQPEGGAPDGSPLDAG